MSGHLRVALLAAAVAGVFAPLHALAGDGRLLATGGVSMIEGSSGGGIVPWATLSGYGTRDELGTVAFATHVDSGDYRLDVQGAALTVGNRLELSLARQRLDLGTLQDQLGLPWNALGQDVFGAKVRLAGDLVYGHAPQVSLGVQYKRLRNGTLPLAIGARDDHGTDIYLSASRLLLQGAAGYQLLLNGALRATRANQAGLLGFGGDRRNSYRLVPEVSAAVVLSPSWAVGVEYRDKPNNLGFAREQAWADAFVAWFPNKHVSLTAAWADLGDIATLADQRGPYLSLQVAF
ncbi:DUF3034 family protein [Xanthomonas citri pv. glycines]|uniref:DUF3034 family protein n=1 Tax=Xanthomonas campestris pv. glycines TaxID=473421 RepID=A0AAX0I0F0_XANCG|nr:MULTISPECIES: DUF3034 family protein [Xanthomonas]AOY62516.1 DUF3034 domain-containing protein [Xanthomonas citri pv. glycines str. 8ra]ARV23774.1 hypothetical protein A9D66_14520 [Xanthomonas citri pv. glycines str. 12-2]EWC52093.1 hypothetical protein XAR_1391 [Xanthomonas citri pv. glycines str. 8ra]OEY90220.1 hypothetical protein BIY41_14510 [Xanthomonas citri pv. glycines]OOX05994.1 hypothetical protein Xgly_06090 [Xanthomonas citri pv. glycines]